MGLHRAGFRVIGVDLEKHKRYPFEFVQADALTYPLAGAAFVWASPNCQGYTEMRHAPGAVGKPRLIPQFRARMPKDVPWCIENVEDAAWDMIDPITLCGSMFDLGSQGCRLQRHRLFETNFPLAAPECRHDARPVIGVYGGHARRRAASAGGRGTKDVWRGGHKAAASEAMGIDWMTLDELSEAIPPAYAEYIGRAALKQINLSARQNQSEEAVLQYCSECPSPHQCAEEGECCKVGYEAGKAALALVDAEREKFERDSIPLLLQVKEIVGRYRPRETF